MRVIGWQVLVAAIGLAVVGALLFAQSSGLEVSYSPASGGEYVEAVVGQPTFVNPLLRSQAPADRDLAALTQAGLMRLDAGGLPVPDLAASWAVTADGLSYTFVLREGLRWSDGFPLTLDDVLFSLRLLQAPDFPGAPDLVAMWGKVIVAKLNATTLKLTLPEPYAPFLEQLVFYVQPAHVFAPAVASELGRHPANARLVGAGPFMLKELVSNSDGTLQEAVLTPNANHFGVAPMLESVRLRFMPQAESAEAALRGGAAMGWGGAAPAAVAALLSDSQLQVYSAPVPKFGVIYLNQRNAAVDFFAEKKVRQALLLAFNRQGFVDAALQGQGIVARGPVAEGTWAQKSDLVSVAYDPKRATELLATANWQLPVDALAGTEGYAREKQGKRLVFTLAAPDDAMGRILGQLVAESWKKLGVQATVQLMPPAELYENMLPGRQFEAVLAMLNLETSADPDPYLFWHQTEIETGLNYSGYENRAISELLERARVSTSIAERSRLYDSFQARFADETPALILYQPVYSYAVSRQVRGVQLGTLLEPSDRFQSVSDWYMVTRRTIRRIAKVP